MPLVVRSEEFAMKSTVTVHSIMLMKSLFSVEANSCDGHRLVAKSIVLSFKNRAPFVFSGLEKLRSQTFSAFLKSENVNGVIFSNGKTG